jgi:hypothetical protein
MVDRLRLTVAEAAEALAVSDDTIRRGLAGTGPLADLLRDVGHRDNTGRWVIELTAKEIERHRSIRRRQHTPPHEPLVPLAEAELAQLRERVDALQSATEAASGALKEEIQRLAKGHEAMKPSWHGWPPPMRPSWAASGQTWTTNGPSVGPKPNGQPRSGPR